MFSPKFLCQPWGERFTGTCLVGVMGLIQGPDSGQHEVSPRAAAGLSTAGVHACVCTCTHASCVRACGCTHVSKASIFVHFFCHQIKILRYLMHIELMQLNRLDVLKP